MEHDATGDKEIQFPDQFTAVGGTEVWFTSIIEESMRIVYTLSFDDNLENAISTAKIYVDTKEQEDQLTMLTFFLRKEKSGNLKPPPSMKALYKKVISSMKP